MILPGMPFAPGDYSIDYLFAAVMTANPLVWMKVTGLEAEDVIRLNKVVSVYKKHSCALFEADISPAGQMPSGMSFTGFCCEVTDTEGYLLLTVRLLETALFIHTETASYRLASDMVT